MGEIFTETESGVEQQFLFCDTRLLATCYLLNKVAIHFRKDIVILRGFLHGFWISLHMHQANRQTGFCSSLQSAWFGKGANIVNNVSANFR